MPVYEYECTSCAKVFENWQRISDPNLTVCPNCGGGVRKLVSSSSFHLKGGGWYVTDYCNRGGDKKDENASGKGSSASSSATGGSKDGSAATSSASS